MEAENSFRVKKAELDARSREAEAHAEVAGEIARVREQKILEDERIELNEKKYRADVIVPAQAEMEASQMRAKGDAARIVEEGRATAEAVKFMRQEWEKGDTRDLFLIQMLPEIIEKITGVISENLEIERLTVLDSGSGNGIPTAVKGFTGTVVTVMEELKNTMGIDIPGIIKARGEQRS